MQRGDLPDAGAIILRIARGDHLAEGDGLTVLFNQKHRPFAIGDPFSPKSGTIGEVGPRDDVIGHDPAVGDIPRLDMNARHRSDVSGVRAPDQRPPSLASQSSSDRGQSALSSRESERSASTRPPVWQIAQ